MPEFLKRQRASFYLCVVAAILTLYRAKTTQVSLIVWLLCPLVGIALQKTLFQMILAHLYKPINLDKMSKTF